jgi:2,3-bisphosphoglycerate-independent phosphoglycerate mutase
MVLLRGFSKRPVLPTLGELYKLNAAAIATYPMYRGLAKLVGMEILKTGDAIADEFDTLVQHYNEYDFFYLHIKQSDSAGEDGDFEGKVRVIEEVDALLPRLTALEPDVLIVTGDHSTPAVLKSHSWHPVPFLLYSRYCRPDNAYEFSERACSSGALGRFPAIQVMPLALAHALRLDKFGA